jgi:hypothetical protein
MRAAREGAGLAERGGPGWHEGKGRAADRRGRERVATTWGRRTREGRRQGPRSRGRRAREGVGGSSNRRWKKERSPSVAALDRPGSAAAAGGGGCPTGGGARGRRRG